MKVFIWNIKAKVSTEINNVKSIYNSSLDYFKLTYSNNTKEKFSTDEYTLEFIYSDN